MSQLIVDSLLLREDQIPIAALLAVSPGFKTALTPWYITKHGNDLIAYWCPLPWKMIRFLHAVSPFSFQFATSLCVIIDNGRELHELITSDAVKSLYRQVEKLKLVTKSLSSDLTRFIEQFGMLRRLEILFGFVCEEQCLELFCNMLSSKLVTSNYHVTLDTVRAFEKFYESSSSAPSTSRNIHYLSDAHLKLIDARECRILSILSELMVEYFKKDDGCSFLVFLDCIAKTVCRLKCQITPKCYAALVPALDLVERCILNGDFSTVVLRSLSFVKESNKELMFKWPCPSDIVVTKACGSVLDILNWCLLSSQKYDVLLDGPGWHYHVYEVPSIFFERYGPTLINRFAQIVFDSRNNQNGRLHVAFRNNKSVKKVNAHRDTNMKLFLLFKEIKNRESNLFEKLESSPLENFPFELFCECLDTFGTFLTAQDFSRVLTWIKYVATDRPEPLLPYCDNFATLARKLFTYFRNFDVDDVYLVMREAYEYDEGDEHREAKEAKQYWSSEIIHECIFKPFIGDGLTRLLFGFFWGDDDEDEYCECDSSDEDRNTSFMNNDKQSFHKFMRQSFFGTNNLSVVDETLDWAQSLIIELTTEVAKVEAHIVNLENEEENDEPCRIKGVELFFRFIQEDICSFLKKLVSVVLEIELRDVGTKYEIDVRIVRAKAVIDDCEKMKSKLAELRVKWDEEYEEEEDYDEEDYLSDNYSSSEYNEEEEECEEYEVEVED